MNRRCPNCNGKGLISKDGRKTISGKPYDLVCPQCNGVGHYPERSPRYV